MLQYSKNEENFYSNYFNQFTWYVRKMIQLIKQLILNKTRISTMESEWDLIVFIEEIVFGELDYEAG